MFYVWDKVVALERYGLGHVIIDGDDISVDQARREAKEGVEQWLKENRDWLFVAPNEDDLEQLKKMRAQFATDLEAEPKSMNCLLIQGSD